MYRVLTRRKADKNQPLYTHLTETTLSSNILLKGAHPCEKKIPLPKSLVTYDHGADSHLCRCNFYFVCLFLCLFNVHQFHLQDAKSEVQATCQGFTMLGVMCAWMVLFGVSQSFHRVNVSFTLSINQLCGKFNGIQACLDDLVLCFGTADTILYIIIFIIKLFLTDKKHKRFYCQGECQKDTDKGQLDAAPHLKGLGSMILTSICGCIVGTSNSTNFVVVVESITLRNLSLSLPFEGRWGVVRFVFHVLQLLPIRFIQHSCVASANLQ